MNRADLRRLLRPCLSSLFFQLMNELCRRAFSVVDSFWDPKASKTLYPALKQFTAALLAEYFGSEDEPDSLNLDGLILLWARRPDIARVTAYLGPEDIPLYREVGFSVDPCERDSAEGYQCTLRYAPKASSRSLDAPAVDLIFAEFMASLRPAPEQSPAKTRPSKKRRCRHE